MTTKSSRKEHSITLAMTWRIWGFAYMQTEVHSQALVPGSRHWRPASQTASKSFYRGGSRLSRIHSQAFPRGSLQARMQTQHNAHQTRNANISTCAFRNKDRLSLVSNSCICVMIKQPSHMTLRSSKECVWSTESLGVFETGGYGGWSRSILWRQVSLLFVPTQNPANSCSLMLYLFN